MKYYVDYAVSLYATELIDVIRADDSSEATLTAEDINRYAKEA